MSYQNITIKALLEGINRDYFLPAIQREYVWKPEQIITLIDSILRGYPINSFLFWNVTPENFNRWDVYEFIKDFDPRSPHNRLIENKDSLTRMTLVLDGQQRLTSLYIALSGSYAIKKKYASQKSKAWQTKKLYLNLLSNPSVMLLSEDESDVGLRYELSFMDENEVPTPNQDVYWFSLGRILSLDTEEKRKEFLNQARANVVGEDKRDLFKDNFDSLYNRIWKEAIVSFFPEEEQDLDRVLDIFARTNMGGTKLTKSDLLLSMVTAKWQNVNARQDIHVFVEELNEKLDRNNSFDKDFVLKTALALTDLPVAYQVGNFTKANLDLILQSWDAIKQAIRKTVMLINSFGIDKETLTSANAIIPIVYYIHKNSKTDLQGSSNFETYNRTRIQRWLIMVLMNKVFSGQSDNMLTNTRRILKEIQTGDNFPIEGLNQEIIRMGRRADFTAALEEVLETAYGEREAFLALSLLYDEKGWGTLKFHIDHIFPKSSFETKKLKKLNYSEEQIQHLNTLCNRLGNLQLLTGTDNVRKSDADFEQWLTSRSNDFYETHLIPENTDLYKWDCFESFVDAREILIKQRLENLFSE